ncbi:MAG: hypothetical protein A2231_05885 [Candidatus Firestonebacteria bacterium RIFOXYA2_FULL_40_8]|nr:MAG: hypothetical protein A2231_05885 [Candidatus Firestonebacteria bacterium RIFOXYA2_FULL_40_8]
MTITKLAALFAFNVSLLMTFMFFILYFFYKSERELKYLAVLFFSTGIYAIGQFTMEEIKIPEQIIFWHKFEHIGVILMAPAWLNFCYEYTKRKKDVLIRILNYSALLFLGILYTTPLLITNETALYGGEFLQGKEGPLYFLMLLSLSVSLGYGYFLLVRRVIKTKQFHSYNIVLLIGTALAILFGLHDVLILLKINIFGINTTLFEYGLYLMSFSLVYSWVIARGFQEKELIKDVFQRYVAYPVLKGEGNFGMSEVSIELEVSVVFADIRGFTALSEKLKASEIVDILNKYYSNMTAIAEEYGGIVDKFIGDNVMAVFGVGEKVNNHPLLAARAACDMRDKVHKFFGPEYKDMINIGIGVNTGKVIMGPMGSHRKKEYTIIGETVNMAACLEDRAYRNQILITGEVYNKIEKYIKAKKLDELCLKDKDRPVTIYELEGIKQY